MDTILSSGALRKMINGESGLKPVLQLLGSKNVTSPNDNTGRFRCVFSDGVEMFNCCIVLNNAIPKNGQFERFCIVKVNSYLINLIQGRDIIIMAEFEYLKQADEVGGKIGNPVSIDKGSGNSDSKAAPVNGRATATNGQPSGSGLNRQTNTNNNRNLKPMNVKRESTLNPEGVIDIKCLNPYTTRWTIKGRVTSKGGIRTWCNPKGEGKLFSFNIKDESGEIKVTGFKAECDKFYELIEAGKVYLVSRGQLKDANKRFSDLQHDYEVTLNEETVIEPYDDTTVPEISYNFVKINDIAAKPADSFVDVVGICRTVGDLVTFKQKNTERELRKRDISLVDDSEAEICLTLWGDEASAFASTDGTCILAKKAKVSEFNGKSLSCNASSLLQVEPSIPETYGLKGWYLNSRDSLKTTNLSAAGNNFGEGVGLRYLADITMEYVGQNSNNISYMSNATIRHISDIKTYNTCPDGCKKKLIDFNNGTYKCEQCNKDFQSYKHNYILRMIISDCTSETWVTVFNADAEMLLGMSADELVKIRENNKEEYEDILMALNFKSFSFRLKTLIDTYKDETRLKTTAQAVIEVGNVALSKRLISLISEN